MGFSAHTVAATIQSSRNYDDERKRIPTYRTTLISILGARGWVVLLSSRFRKASPGAARCFSARHIGEVFSAASALGNGSIATHWEISGSEREGEESQHKGFSGSHNWLRRLCFSHLFSALTAREGVGSSWRGRRLRDAANKGVDLLVPLYALFCTILAVLLKQKEKNTCLPYLTFFLMLRWCCSE